MLSYIFAEDLNHGIGYHNELPWHISNDLKHFKEITLNHIIIMGYNTYKSLHCKPLPYRTNIVLTHKDKSQCDTQNLKFMNLKQLKKYINDHSNQELIIIGGNSLFQLFKSQVDKIYLTKIFKKYNTDIQVPLDLTQFEIVNSSPMLYDNQEQTQYCFETLKRK